jgi:hypothetical protein
LTSLQCFFGGTERFNDDGTFAEDFTTDHGWGGG